jgi:hypothetical protein
MSDYSFAVQDVIDYVCVRVQQVLLYMEWFDFSSRKEVIGTVLHMGLQSVFHDAVIVLLTIQTPYKDCKTGTMGDPASRASISRMLGRFVVSRST